MVLSKSMQISMNERERGQQLFVADVTPRGWKRLGMFVHFK